VFRRDEATVGTGVPVLPLTDQPVAFVKPSKDGGRPVLLEFDGLPEIPVAKFDFMHSYLVGRVSTLLRGADPAAP
jgi:hypothetical protein